jgi:outer membrane lipoprotein-sorting protein
LILPRRVLLPALIVLVIFLESCATLRPELGPPVSSEFADALMQNWRDKAISINSIQGLAKIKLKAPLNNINANQVLLVERPNRLRAETLSPFGVPLLLLVADGEKMGALLPSQNIYYQGSSSPENLGAFVNLPLALSDLVSVLLYQPEMIEPWKKEFFTLKAGGWLLIHKGTLQRQEFIFNDMQELIEVSYFKENDLFLKVQYAEFSESENSYPKLLTLEIPEKYATITLEFSDVEVNGQIRPELFKIAPPASARVVYLPN